MDIKTSIEERKMRKRELIQTLQDGKGKHKNCFQHYISYKENNLAWFTLI